MEGWFKKTLLKLFSFAYRSRSSIPTIISIAYMLSKYKPDLNIEWEDRIPVEEDDFSDDSDEDSDDSTLVPPLSANLIQN